MNLLILDTETSGLMDDPKARLIEVAVALYSVEERSIIATHSHLEPLPAGELNGAYSANKITDGLLDRATQLRWGTWDQVYNLAIEAEAVVAHDRDGTFDRHFVRKAIGDHLAWQRISEGLPWINSLDIQYEQSEVGGRRSLDFLACRHEIVPFGPWRHRAVWDVLLVAALLGRAPDLPAQVVDLCVPRASFRALVPYADRQLAKDAGFAWDGERRIWWRRLREDTPLEPTPERPFPLVRIEEVGEQVGQQVGQAVPKGVA